MKHYKEGGELCGFEGVHSSLCSNEFLDGDLELTEKGILFIEGYAGWESVEAYQNKMVVKIKR